MLILAVLTENSERERALELIREGNHMLCFRHEHLQQEKASECKGAWEGVKSALGGLVPIRSDFPNEGQQLTRSTVGKNRTLCASHLTSKSRQKEGYKRCGELGELDLSHMQNLINRYPVGNIQRL